MLLNILLEIFLAIEYLFHLVNFMLVLYEEALILLIFRVFH